jgi:steroid delta-isomerase-like uncharacterized protein
MIHLTTENTAILLRHVAAETAFDMEATLATLTPDCEFVDVPLGEIHRGHGGVRRYYTEWWTAFENVATNSRRYVPSDDCLIVETHFVGRHVGPYRGIPPTGRPINLPLSIFVGFRDGLMSGERFYYDRATLLAQIGAADVR